MCAGIEVDSGIGGFREQIYVDQKNLSSRAEMANSHKTVPGAQKKG